jgi:hypothetical protein
MFCIAALAAGCGCGSPGAPVPPSLELPKPVHDLRAFRKGDQVRLTWTVPSKTTEGQSVRHRGPTLICRSMDASMNECGAPVASVPPAVAPKVSGKTPTVIEASYTDTLPKTIQQQSPLSEIAYAISVGNSSQRSAGLSNRVLVPAAPTLPPPAGLNAQVTERGVVLSWQPVAPPPATAGLRFIYRISRRPRDAEHGIIIAQLPLDATQFIDRRCEWEKAYDYSIMVTTIVSPPGGEEWQVEGDNSPPLRVLAHDIFPPAVPAGLEAVASGVGEPPFIDLIWAPDTDSDLAGYNVYRRQAGGEWTKINSELVETPAYRDSGVAPGNQYFYSVSAVDLRGNESRRSAEANERIP